MNALLSSPVVRTAIPENRELVISSLLLAFADDPAVRWMYPDAHQFRTFFPSFVRAFAGQAFALGTAHYVEGWHGVSLWLPPGAGPDESVLMPLLEETVASARREELFAVLDRMSACHPVVPHWHLPLLGVDPRYQRRGFGSALLTPMLESFDSERTVAYLECTNPKYVSFYEAHGFAVSGEIQCGSSPTIYAMTRQPQ